MSLTGGNPATRSQTAALPPPLRPLRPPRDLDAVTPVGFHDPLMSILSYLPETRPARRASQYISQAYRRAHELDMQMGDGSTSIITTEGSSSSSSDFPPYPSVIVDGGSGMTKAGFGGDDAPRAVFPSIVGRLRHPGIMIGSIGAKGCYVGDDAQMRRGILNISRPTSWIGSKTSQEWEDWEKLMHHTLYNELRVEPETHDLLMSETHACPDPANRHQMMQILFETLGVKSLTLQHESVLELFSDGMETGLTVDIGWNSTRITPVYSGNPIRSAFREIAGMGSQKMVDYAGEIMEEDGYAFHTTAEKEILRDMVQKLCVVDPEPGRVMQIRSEKIGRKKSGRGRGPEISGGVGFGGFDDQRYIKELTKRDDMYGEYELPDGQVIPCHNLRSQVPEFLFFHPEEAPLSKSEASSNSRELRTSLSKEILSVLLGTKASSNSSDTNDRCGDGDTTTIDNNPSSSTTTPGHGCVGPDLDMVAQCLLPNIRLYGGGSRFPNLPERLTTELRTELVSRGHCLEDSFGNKIKVSSSPSSSGPYAAWIGGSLLASLSSADEICPAMLKDDYYEFGAATCLERRKLLC